MGWGEWGWGWQEDPTPSSLPAPDWNSDHVGLGLGILVGGGEKVPPSPRLGPALSSPRQAWETGVQMNTGCELAGPASAQFN